MSDPKFPVRHCPKGHPAGTAFGGGFRCSGKSCGQLRAAENALNPKPIVQKMPENELAYIERKNLAGLPDQPLTGDEAVEWSKEKLQKMVPEAVAILQWNMRRGTDRQKEDAAAKVMAANGLDKREAAVTRATPTIVVNIGTGDSKAPWLERLKKAGDK